MKLKNWIKLDLFTGIRVFVEWCEQQELDYTDPENFTKFKEQLK
jgi:hypothetical protein